MTHDLLSTDAANQVRNLAGVFVALADILMIRDLASADAVHRIFERLDQALFLRTTRLCQVEETVLQSRTQQSLVLCTGYTCLPRRQGGSLSIITLGSDSIFSNNIVKYAEEFQ